MKHTALIGILIGALLALALNTSCNHRAHARALQSHAQEPIQVTIDKAMNQLHQFPTLQEAAVYAIQRAYKCSHYYECGGLIATSANGKIFYVGSVRTDFHGDSVQLGHVGPPGYKIVADYHTHPCLGTSHYVSVFSPEDLSQIIEHDVIGIMGDLCTGEVHLYDPRSMPPTTVTLEENAYSTPGIVIGKIAVDGVSLEADTGI